MENKRHISETAIRRPATASTVVATNLEAWEANLWPGNCATRSTVTTVQCAVCIRSCVQVLVVW